MPRLDFGVISYGMYLTETISMFLIFFLAIATVTIPIPSDAFALVENPINACILANLKPSICLN